MPQHDIQRQVANAPTTIFDVLRRTAADHGGREAVVDGDTRLTYDELIAGG